MSTQPLDPGLARRNADRGVAAVTQGADSGWLDRAYGAVVRVAERQPEFHADDVWEELGDDVPDEARALGTVMRRIAKDGIAAPTDLARRSSLKNCNQHWRPIWRSLIHRSEKG